MNVVITGANRGIGLALSQHYARLGHSVIGLCRESAAELASCTDHVITGIDICDRDSYAKLAQQLPTIDLLINNAGLLDSETLGELHSASLEQQMQVNAFGPLRLSESLLGKLSRGSKIAFITSRMGSIADNGSGGYYGYRMSKAALNAGAVSMAHDLAERDISVALLHPGLVSTRMVNYNGMISPEQAAEGLSERIAELNIHNSGGFWHSNGDSLPW